ncbi:MAG: MFS transporter [Pseudomonadota bacterium]
MAWRILLALTFARMSMGFQFQAVPALSEALVASGAMSYAGVGTLTGVYLIPGVVVSLVGGWLGSRFSDTVIVMTALVLMSGGGFAGWVVSGFDALLFWRLVAGIGAVCLNVFATKMAGDWFESRSDLPAAMGVLVSSWPFGLALAALVVPSFEARFGASFAELVPIVFCAVSLVVVALVWSPPDARGKMTEGSSPSSLSASEWKLVLIAGSIWGIYNVGFVGVIAWVPGMLEDMGANPLKAAARASLIGWTAILSVAAGGWLAARLHRKDSLALASFCGSAGLLLILPFIGSAATSVAPMLILGLLLGPAAPMIMTLPVSVSRAEVRAKAMGLYFALYYLCMGTALPLLGALRDATGSATAPPYAAAGCMILSSLLWIVFRTLQNVSDR